MNSYVFCLEPEKKIYDKILRIKKQFLKEVGPSLYLKDPPHITLGVLKLDEKFLKGFEEFNKKFLKSFDNKVEINGKKVFSEDIVTGKEAPVYTIKLKEELKEMQKNLLQFLNDYRGGQIVKRYTNKPFNGQFKESLDKYGYPFSGECWIPHIGIASIDKKRLEKSKIDWKREIIEKEYYVSYFVIYLLNEKNEELKEIKRITLC